MEAMEVDGVEKAAQGKVTGVIIPPPEIRAVVDKTALFVARNGKSFEQRILASGEGQTAKFNFMKPYDPYHAYYEMKIREGEEGKAPAAVESAAPVVQEGGGAEESKGGDAPAPPSVAVSTSVKATILNPVAQLAKIKATEPPAFEFSLTPPAGLTALDVEVVKLAAQHTAVNGREFLASLAAREARNPQFDFLRPTHMLFSYFTALVDVYAKIVRPSQALRERVSRLGGGGGGDNGESGESAGAGAGDGWGSALQGAVQRWTWTREEAQRRRLDASEADSERQAFQAVDWADFSVVETIDFGNDELLTLEGAGGDGGVGVGVGVGGGDVVMGCVGVDAGVGVSVGMEVPQEEEEAEEVVEHTEDVSDLKVVANFQHRFGAEAGVGSGGVGGSGGLLMIDPISGKAVPVGEMEEHMRVQLLDPRWRQQQQRFVDKQRDTGFAGGDSIADNLKIFARKRGDIFGQAATGGGADSAAVIAQQAAAEAARQAVQAQVQWDGFYGTKASTQAARADLVHQMPAAFVAPQPTGRQTAGPAGLSGFRPPAAPTPAAPMSMAPMPMSMPMMAPPPPMQAPGPPPGPPGPYPPHIPPPYSLPPPPPMQMQMQAPMPPVPMQMQMPMPAPAPYAPPYDPPMPASKKARVGEESLMPAHEFSLLFPSPITLLLQLPTPETAGAVPDAWNLHGQTLSLTLPVGASIKALKELASAALGGMPPSKQQVRAQGGFLKDSLTLAELNIGQGALLELSVKSRGGKR